jgi:hypothetical protein
MANRASNSPRESPARGETEPIREIAILWITAGLGCDGESVALTGASQPSIEDIVLGGLPGLPKVNFYNPFYSNVARHSGSGAARVRLWAARRTLTVVVTEPFSL